ncbi:MAG: SNF2 helicase-associated domain-containing protein, partial [Acidobacteria bacterium]|nr:SNF2 helicase-associated domain-containing protein [Acidobacteriota bacterium]
MPLTYVPEKRHLVSWGEPLTRALDPCPTDLASEAIRVVVPPGVVEVVRGPAYQPRLVVSFLGIATDEEIDTLEPSAAAYALASRIALDFVRRESVIPVLVGSGSETRLRWTAAPSSEDRALLAALAASFPPAAHAAAVPGAPAGYVESADVVLRAFVNDAIDSFMRATPQDSLLRRIGSAPSAPAATSHARWEERFVEAARTARAAFAPAGLTEQHVAESLGRWAEHALSTEAHFELTLKLELPAGGPLLFPLVSKITAPGDPTFSMSTAEVLRMAPGTAPVGVEKALRKGLLRAGELFPFLADRLPRLAATDLVLDADETWTFVNRGAVVPVHGGLRVELPAELKGLEKRRIETRLRVGREDERDGPGAGLSLDQLVPFEWEALLGEEPLSRKELEELAHSKGSLVRLRGQWIAVDRESLETIRERVLGKKLDTRAILRAALTGEHRDGHDDGGTGVPVEVRGALVNLLAALRDVGEDAPEPRPIKGLVAELRPYQEKGVSWLR